MNKIIYPAFLFPRQLANLKKSNKYSNIFRFFFTYSVHQDISGFC